MASDREQRRNTTIVTRITYTLTPQNKLRRRTQQRIRDKDGIVQILSDDTEVVADNKDDYKNQLTEFRNTLIAERDNQVKELNEDIRFLGEQITEIEAL